MTLLTAIERARADRRPVDVKRLALTALFVLPFVLGWLAGMAFAAASWAWTAVIVGWRTAGEQAGKRRINHAS